MSGFERLERRAMIGFGLLLAVASAGEARPDGVFVERLSGASEYAIGCFDPCACPVSIAEEVRGTLTLRRIDENQLFTTYAVEGMHLAVDLGGTVVRLNGGGTFRVGGEFARVQEMQLDLSTDGRAPEHFSSGVVAVLADPPAVDVTVSIHGIFCFDTVIRLVAEQDCGDFNGDGAATSQDVFDFLGAFFAGEPTADFDLDGEVSSQDFFAFLTAFFGGCA